MKHLPNLAAAAVAGFFLHSAWSYYWPGTNLPTNRLREGDLVFQSLPHNALVDMIEGVSQSAHSHCGILKQSGQEWVVLESLGRVRETPLPTWKAQARDRKYTVYRLVKAYHEWIPAFLQAAGAMEGRPYDTHYAWDDEAIYCSELLAKAFQTATGEMLGKRQRLGQLNWQPYAATIEALEQGTIPLEREMVTPRSITESGFVELVQGN